MIITVHSDDTTRSPGRQKVCAALKFESRETFWLITYLPCDHRYGDVVQQHLLARLLVKVG
eukprot:scaffold349666_cov18-Prasinocladus_malaysianus.AAC.1